MSTPPQEWTVIIRCPGCGRRAGEVIKWADNPMRVNLLTDPAEYIGCLQRRCPALRWPTEAQVLRAAERAVQRPDRTARLRAVAVPDTDPRRPGRRGAGLGEGPPDSVRSRA